MRRHVILPLALVASLVALAAVAISADPPAAPPAFHPEARVVDLMELNRDLNKAIRDELRGTPNWDDLEHQARLVAEIANILRYHRPASETDWWTFAGAIRRTGSPSRSGLCSRMMDGWCGWWPSPGFVTATSWRSWSPTARCGAS